MAFNESFLDADAEDCDPPRVAGPTGGGAITLDGIRLPNPLPRNRPGSRVTIYEMRVPFEENDPGIRVAAAWGSSAGWGKVDIETLVTDAEADSVRGWKENGCFTVDFGDGDWLLVAFDADGGIIEGIEDNYDQFWSTRFKGEILGPLT